MVVEQCSQQLLGKNRVSYNLQKKKISSVLLHSQLTNMDALQLLLFKRNGLHGLLIVEKWFTWFTIFLFNKAVMVEELWQVTPPIMIASRIPCLIYLHLLETSPKLKDISNQDQLL